MRRGGADADVAAGRDEAPEIPGFVIERELGRGGMSVVYLARQPSLGRRVALKVVRSGPAAGSREYARWLREGRSFSLLRHDNVVRLYDVGEADGWLYLVLEYVPGGTLNAGWTSRMPPRDAARLLGRSPTRSWRSTAPACSTWTSSRPTSCSTPPALPASGRCPGWATSASPVAGRPRRHVATASPIGPVGTPRYMAPEQVGAGRDRPRAGGRRLRPGRPALSRRDRPAAVRGAVGRRDARPGPRPGARPAPAAQPGHPPRPRDDLPEMPAQGAGPAVRARPQAVADDLRRFLDGGAIAARPASPAEKTWRWCRRRPAVAALAAALAITLSAGFLGMFLLWRHAEAARGLAEFHTDACRGGTGRFRVRVPACDGGPRRAGRPQFGRPLQPRQGGRSRPGRSTCSRTRAGSSSRWPRAGRSD